MSATHKNRGLVTATTHEVLPRFGLAFVIDEHNATWSITRSMKGPGLDALNTGQRVQLTPGHHDQFSVVRAYQPLD